MEWFREIKTLILVFLLQVLLFNHLQIGSWGFPMIYILFLLNLPVRIPRWAEMLIGVGIGLLMDVWYSSLGVHLAACVAVTFLRPILLNNMVQNIERIKDNVCSRTIGAREYTKCTVFLTLIHHFTVYLLEAWSLQNWWVILLQTAISSSMTLIIILGYDRLNN